MHLVAHSISAWQAMALAAERPELLRTLVLEEPADDLRDAVPECSLTNASEAELGLCISSLAFSAIAVKGSTSTSAAPSRRRRSVC